MSENLIPHCWNKGYQRQRDLPGLLCLWPHEINATEADSQRRLIAKLRCALRAERGRGRAGHWSYDLERHLKLVRAYKREVEELERLIASATKPGRKANTQGSRSPDSVASYLPPCSSVSGQAPT